METKTTEQLLEEVESLLDAYSLNTANGRAVYSEDVKEAINTIRKQCCLLQDEKAELEGWRTQFSHCRWNGSKIVSIT